MASGKTSSKPQKAWRERYKAENRALTNKIAKLERHLKSQPDDEQTKAALAKLRGSGYTGRSAASRTSARMLNGTSLNRLCGRLGRGGKEYQALAKIAKAGINESNYKSAEERKRIAEFKAKADVEKGKTKTRKQRKAKRS